MQNESKMKKSIFIISMLLLTCFQVFSQSVPVNKRFGKVSAEEVSMTTYPKDTSAAAVVLYEKEDIMLDMDANGRFVLITDRHMRVKVLKEEGLDWADHSILRYVDSDLRETVSGIDVVTYNLEDGKVKATKMAKQFVYDEEYSDSYRKTSFYAQDVKVGSVIEMKFRFTSQRYWDVGEIYFQREIPVNLMESVVRLPDMFTFNKKMSGYYTPEYTSEFESRTLSLGGSPYTYNVNLDRYVVTDVPAFKVEPYVYAPRQYYSSVKYDISALVIPGILHENYGVSWDDIDVSYRDSDIMQRFRAGCQFKDEVALLPNEGADADRIAAAVSLVKSNVEWDRTYKIYPNPLGQVVKSKSGSNAEINCLIAGCLREMGYTVDMVMVKMRSSGYLLDFQPEMYPFDTFIVRAVASDGKEYFVDGGSSNTYVNILPPTFLITNGRIIRNSGRGEWVNLTGRTRSSIAMSVSAELNPQMQMTGKVTRKETGNASYASKNLYDSYDDEEEYISDIESDNSIEIDEIEFEGMTEYSPSASMTYTFTKDLDSASDLVYVNPFITAFHSKDSFQSITREYPVDFPYPYNLNYLFTMAIPEGYAVEQMPQNMNFRFDPIGASVRCIFSANGNAIQMVFNYSQTKTMCEVSQYEHIRTFWQYLADLYDSVVVLKKL